MMVVSLVDLKALQDFLLVDYLALLMVVDLAVESALDLAAL